MSVLTPTELGTHLDMDGGEIAAATVQLQRAIDTAELTVAQELGTLKLERLAVVDEDITIRTDRKSIELTNGLLQAITSLTLDGKTIDLANISTGLWLVQYSEGFRRGGVVVLNYNAGYLDSTEMPDAMVRGILELAEFMYKGNHKGRRKTSERIGDYAVTYKSDGSGLDAPEAVKSLLRRFKRARL